MISFLTDILLPRPWPDQWFRFLMYATFTVHLFWVLIMLGSALIGLYYHWIVFRTKDDVLEVWNHHMHQIFVAPKAIAVVLGVGALLVTQLHFALPLYTSYVFFGPWWLSSFVAMVAAFLLLEGANHRYKEYPVGSLVFDILGVLILMAIPAVFVTIVVGMEYTDRWAAIVESGFRFRSELIFHWLSRYLHIIGAAVVFGAGFHYVTESEGISARRRAMLRWIVAGMLIQFLAGGVLAITLQEWLSKWVLLPLALGIGLSVLLVWIIFDRLSNGDTMVRSVLVLLPLVLVSMLLTRQFIQQQKVLPFLHKAEENAQSYNRLLGPYRDRETIALNAQLQTVYDTGQNIFTNSCAVCHGISGAGDGPSGLRLVVSPERIAQIRGQDNYLRSAILGGVPGTGMPYFSIYDKSKIDDLIAYLDGRFHVLAYPGKLPATISSEDAKAGQRYFQQTCALCHGVDGRRSEYAAPLRPSPPDFTQFNLTPQRAFEVITQGYPGTAMQPFGGLPDTLRWSLVQQVNSFRAARANE